jgi:RNA polymerase sigma-70 factor (ECF subfamily)
MHSEIVQRCKAGDASAFEEIHNLYGHKLYSLCYRMSGSHENAEDLMQEIFIILVKRIKSYRGDAKFSTWLHRVGVNACIDYLRKNKFQHVEINENAPYVQDTSSAKRLEQSHGIKKALIALPAGYRAVIVLHDIQGYKHAEIAKMRGTSEGAVKSQLFKARRKMRLLLNGDPATGSLR